MTNNRLAGVVLLTVGICWLVVLPAFLWFMVSMEARTEPSGADGATWRLWRALEVLLVEPRWLATTLSVLLVSVAALGTALLGVGVATLGGNARAPKWAAAATVSGLVLCGIGLAVHRALLMPVVNASEKPEVVRAAGDLDLAMLVALGVGFASMIVVGLALLAARRQQPLAGKSLAQT
jgi:hypothetical protein